MKIRVESTPKFCPNNSTLNSAEWTETDIEKARQIINREREKHLKESKMFRIYKDEELIFDSK